MRTFPLIAMSALAAMLSLTATARNDSPAAPVSAFNGSSLAGWHVRGNADWRVANGDIVVSPGKSAAATSWLVFDHPYEDFILTLSYQCNNSEMGVLFRNAPTSWTRYSHQPQRDQDTTGIYLPLCGANVGSTYRLALNAQGDETNRTLLLSNSISRHGPATVTDGPGDWKTAQISIRGEFPAHEGPAQKPNAQPDETNHFGELAIRFSGQPDSTARLKDIRIEDLTEVAAGLPREITSPAFQKIQLTDRFYAEGIAAGDLNHDGFKDVVVGPFYFLGPDFKVAREIYPPETFNIAGAGQHGNYTDSFLSYVYDFNGDGWPDVLKINFQGAWLYINPRGERRHWDEYHVVKGISAETTQFADIDGDGHPELLMAQGSGPKEVISYATPDWSNPTEPWTIHPISEPGAWGPHGFGLGDLNGDGRVDIVQGSGWWEQPAPGVGGLWKFHAVPFGRGTDPFLRGADILIYDVNKDGLPDVITSLFAHGPGLAWFEQKRDASGEITWKMHTIMGDPSDTPEQRQSWEETDKSVAFTELHALALADMDGDGLPDIVTGKRWWSHGITYDENDLNEPPVLYWFKLVRKAGGQVEFVPHLIDNYSGVGTQILVTDINGDGTPDVLTVARKGAFVFLNHLPGHGRESASRKGHSSTQKNGGE